MEKEKISYGALEALIVGMTVRIFDKKRTRPVYVGAASYCPREYFPRTVAQIYLESGRLSVYLEGGR